MLQIGAMLIFLLWYEVRNLILKLWHKFTGHSVHKSNQNVTHKPSEVRIMIIGTVTTLNNFKHIVQLEHLTKY